MDLTRFAGLFAAETSEHLRQLHRAILGLESGTAAGALEQAFRSVHTIKGLAATMGYRRAARLSHSLEDALESLRSGQREIDAPAVDELLARADELQTAIASGPQGVADPEVEPDTSEIRPRRARVRLRKNAPLKSARALLVVRAAERASVAAGHTPESFGEDFAGELIIRLAPGADEEVAEAAIRAAGEVDAVVFEDDGPEADHAAAGAQSRAAQHVRVEGRRLDDVADAIGELAVLHTRLDSGHRNGSGPALDRMGTLLAHLQHTVMAMRMVPLSEAFEALPRAVRDAARALGKEVELRIEGGEIEIDRAIAEELREPLLHLLRNAVDHGLELSGQRVQAGKPSRGRVTVRATRDGSSVQIEVGDDGGGIQVDRVAARAVERGLIGTVEAQGLESEDLLRIISSAGFSTAEQVTEFSGRGVGMDAVVSRVRALGGAIALDTTAFEGTRFTLRLPITLSVAQALRVRVGTEDYAILLTHVREAIQLDAVMLVPVAGRESVRVRDALVPLVRLRGVLHASGDGEERAAVITELGDRAAALAVDELVGREQILIRSFDAPADALPLFPGATVLADGRPALILDPASVV